MKKILLFLITLLTITITVNAQEPSFYEGNFIGSIYMNKVKDNIIYYQQARFFINKNTNEAVYCIEPFATFNESASYKEQIPNLSNYQKERLSLLSYYGYNYPGHEDARWYAVTQLLIWQTADPSGKYYFTNTLNGTKTNRFDSEIREIESLIQNHYKKPSFNNQTYYLIHGNSLSIKDNNEVLNNYQPTTNNISIENNILSIDKPDMGTHQITIKEKQLNNKQQQFYVSETSQDLLTLGDPIPQTATINLIVQEANLEITKIDTDTKTIIPSGDSSLIGTKFALYDIFDTKLEEYTLTEEKLNIKGLNYGKYYIKEITPGKGYTLNNNKYYFEITKENTTPKLIIENKVIEKEIIIKKVYGTNNNFIPESNISFNIYNSQNEFIKTIKTNEDGLINIKLPYGTYTLKQLTTTEGYQKIDPININVDNSEKEEITLKNYKINVPNTKTTIISTIINKLCQYLRLLLF